MAAEWRGPAVQPEAPHGSVGPAGSVEAGGSVGPAGSAVPGGTAGRPLLRLLRLARPLRGQLLLSVAAGAAAIGCGVALLAVSGFLLARASEHPNIIAISVAVVAGPALSIGRGGSPYVQGLASHDVAVRVLACIRVAGFTRPGRLARPRRRPL